MRNGSKLISDLGLDCDARAHNLELTSTAVGWQEDILIGVSDKPDNQGYCDFHNQHLCSVYFATFVNYGGVGGPVLSVLCTEWRLLFWTSAEGSRPQHKNSQPQTRFRKPVTIPTQNQNKALLIDSICKQQWNKNVSTLVRTLKQSHLQVSMKFWKTNMTQIPVSMQELSGLPHLF